MASLLDRYMAGWERSGGAIQWVVRRALVGCWMTLPANTPKRTVRLAIPRTLAVEGWMSEFERTLKIARNLEAARGRAAVIRALNRGPTDAARLRTAAAILRALREESSPHRVNSLGRSSA